MSSFKIPDFRFMQFYSLLLAVARSGCLSESRPDPHIVMQTLISASAAQAQIHRHLPQLLSSHAALDACAGRILHQAIYADRPFPPFSRSMMDGYALSAAEITPQGLFKLQGEAAAGSPQKKLRLNQTGCIEIMTGAVLPEQADCVVPYEATRQLDDQQVQLLAPAQHGPADCIHHIGSDRPTGALILEPGCLIGSREIAVIASCGYSEVQVSQIPAIAVASSGDELVEVAQRPLAHQIRRSNDLAIQSALAQRQLPTQERAHLPDEPDACRAKLQHLIQHNRIVILSGGISMGKKDFIPQALDQLGLECQFHGVAQKPGKPFGYWSRSDCAVFALPGNPLSTLTCLHYYVIPAILAAMGQSKATAAASFQLATAVKARNDITCFMPVSINSRQKAEPRPAQNSGDLVRILASDGFIELPPTEAKMYPAATSFNFHAWY